MRRTYKSSNTSVVSVNKKSGKINAKKIGTATVTVTFKGHSEKCKLNVVSSTAAFRPLSAGNSEKYANTFVKAYGTKITTKNRYQLLNLYNKAGGFLDSGIGGKYDNGKVKYGIYSATLLRARVRASELLKYVNVRNPFSTQSGKAFNITRLKGSKRTVTATLKSTVTTDQLFAMQYSPGSQTKISKKSKVSFPIYVVDVKTKSRYEATATVSKGSKTMTIKTKNLNMTSGRTYMLHVYPMSGYNNSAWLMESKVVKFKAK